MVPTQTTVEIYVYIYNNIYNIYISPQGPDTTTVISIRGSKVLPIQKVLLKNDQNIWGGIEI